MSEDIKKQVIKDIVKTILKNEYKKTITIKNKLPKDMGRYNCLMIESKRQDIFVYINKYIL